MKLNLSRLATAVEQELQQAPDVRSWRSRVRRTLNDVYEEVWSLKPWPWKIREAPLWVYPDVELSRVEAVFEDSTGTRRIVDLLDVRDLGGRLFPAADALASGPIGAIETHIENLVGAELGLEEPTTADVSTGNWTEGPFVIERAFYTTTPGAANGPVYPNVRLWLDPRCQIESITAEADLPPFQLRFPRYLLPYDCDQLLADGVCDEQGRPLHYLDPARYSWLQGGTERPPRMAGGIPGGWTYDEGYQHTAPMDRAHSPNRWTSGNAPSWFDHNVNVNIRENIGATLASGTSTLTVGQRYRFAVAWYYAGRFGPLSAEVEATPTSALPRVTLTNLPTLPDSALDPAVNYGWVLAVFMAEGDEALYLLQYKDPPPSENDGGGTAGATLTITAPQATADRPFKRLTYEQLAPAHYRYIRILPRPTAHQRYTIRYFMRPKPLADEQDEPLFPEAFHMLLVYGAVARLAAPRSDESARSALYTRMTQLYAAKLAELTQLYFPGFHQAPVKGGILTPAPARWPLTAVDWNGDS